VNDLDAIDSRSGRAIDAVQFQRRAVENHEAGRFAPEAARARNIDGIVGRHAVEIMAIGQVAIDQRFVRVPIIRRLADRHGHDPLAGLAFGGELADAVENVGDRFSPLQRRTKRLQPKAVGMGVCVIKAGYQGASAEIMYQRARSAQFHHRVGASSRQDTAASDGNGFGRTAGAVQHQHVAEQNGICGLSSHKRPFRGSPQTFDS
jgi:hypothetical protein